ncbi:MAG: MFS transporter [Alphaproteobacteria bacterium]|nr:MFS transporter [Alphaproteobacteria bacterium]
MPALPNKRRTLPLATARAVARDLLEQVLSKGRTLDEAAGLVEGHARLEGRDRAFARLLAASVLRRLGSLDAVLARCLDKGAPPMPVRDILRLGAAQLLLLDTPDHAAVGETVALCTGRAASLKGLVNAVLRRLARDGKALLAKLDAARLDTPPWLWHVLSTAYGEDTARAVAGVHAGNPPLDLSVRADPELWAAKLGAQVLPTGTLRLPDAGGLADLPGYAEGAWWVQDAAAALPARLLGDVSGSDVLDLCAAPGGKTLQLAAAGARVTAVDQSKKRLARLVENLARTGLTATGIAADVADWRPATPFPFVLLDAPCTASGTLRRHPEIAYLKSPADADKLVGVQDRLLDAAAEMTAPSGTLVYAVCSLDPREGKSRVAAFLKRNPAFARRRISAAELGGAAELIDANGDLMTLPSHWADKGGMDGFYAARLIRTTA